MVLMMIFFCGRISAQEVSYDLEDFSELKVYSALDIKLTKSNENRAVVYGEKREEVEFNYENGILRVKVSIENVWDKDDDTRVHIFYRDLQKIDANQGSSVLLENEINQQDFTVEVQEASVIVGKVNVRDLYAKSVTAGEIELSGKAEFQDIVIRAGGKYYAKNLLSRDIDITVSAGGVADITASGEVNTTVRAGGTVNVYGDPELIDKNITLGGRVKRLK